MAKIKRRHFTFLLVTMSKCTKFYDFVAYTHKATNETETVLIL